MKKIRNLILFIAPFLVLLILSGCANYAKVVFESANRKYYDVESKMTVQKLVDNWKDYNVSYSGISIPQADGIMFDIKKDDNKMVGDYWKKITDEEAFSTLVYWRVKDRDRGKLYKIMGRNNKLFGYIYCPDPDKNPVAKILDDKTIYVYRISNVKLKYDRDY